MDAWAVVEHGQPLQRIQLPTPEPKAAEVLIEVTHAGICHTDLHFWEGFYDLGGGKKMSVADRGIRLPKAIGHEVVGNVAKLGPEAQGLNLGDRRIVFPWIGCGVCKRCETGDENLCDKPESIGIFRDGGMAKYVVVRHPRYLVDPGNLDPAVACTYACAGTTVLSAVQKLLPLEPSKPVVVMGAGGLGLSAISMLRGMGQEKVISMDINPYSRRAALETGAVAAIDARAADAREQLFALSEGPVSSVLDCVNSSDTASFAFSALAKGGKMVQVGLLGGELNISLVGLVAKSATIMGSSTGTIREIEKLIQMAKDGRVAPIPVTTMPRERAWEALMLLRDGKVTGRLVLT
jgi:alcohol dehydrogenase, propanol-preferring